MLLQLVKKVRSDFLTRGGRMHPVGRDPCVPPQECDFPRRGDVGIAPYERTGGRVRTLGVGDGVLPWSAAEQMPLGYDVPSARRCRAARPPLGVGCRRSRLREREPCGIPPSVSASRCHLPRRGRQGETDSHASVRTGSEGQRFALFGRTESSAPTNSLRQRFALPPPSQREARGIHIPLRGGTHGSRPTASDICDRAGSLTD